MKDKPEIKEARSYENVPQRGLHVHLPAIKAQTAHDGPSERRVQSKVLLLFPEETQHTDTLQPHGKKHNECSITGSFIMAHYTVKNIGFYTITSSFQN